MMRGFHRAMEFTDLIGVCQGSVAGAKPAGAPPARAPAARGHGSHVAPLSQMTIWARSARARDERPFLHTSARHTNAIRLYESPGFWLRRRTAFLAARVPEAARQQ